MPFVDLDLGKIYGCLKGSKVWYHEKAHIVFNKTELGIKINYYGYFFMMVAVFILSLSMLINWLPLRLFGFLNAFGMVVCYLYEELICWIWGLREYKKCIVALEES